MVLKVTFGLIFLVCLFVISVNAFVPKETSNPAIMYGIKAANTSAPMPNYCSWMCHNQTKYCKENHVNFLSNHFKYTDPVYFGIISMLHGTGNYKLANVILFVLILPILAIMMFIKILRFQIKISGLKSKN